MLICCDHKNSPRDSYGIVINILQPNKWHLRNRPIFIDLFFSTALIDICVKTKFWQILLSYLMLSYLILCRIFHRLSIAFPMEFLWKGSGMDVETVISKWYVIYMGSLPYDERHEAPDLVDCDQCNKRFLMYKDKVPTCTECLQNPSIRRQRSRRDTNVSFLFEQ